MNKLVFTASALLANASSAGDTPPRFSMIAYTGGPMRVRGFAHPVVVDLRGLAIPSQTIPIRLDHRPEQGVGHTTSVRIEAGQIVAEGILSRQTDAARDVTRSARAGFPWQASIGGPVLEAELLPEGERAEVNGQTVEGPLQIVRAMELIEISFVDRGADDATRARVEAKEALPQKPAINTQPAIITKNEAPPQAPAVSPTVSPAVSPAEEPAANNETGNKITNNETTNNETGETGSSEISSQKKNAMEQNHTTAYPPNEEPSAGEIDPLTNSLTDWRTRLAAERRRVAAIEKLGGGKFPELEASAIEGGWTPDQFELAFLRQSRPKVVSAAVPHPKATAKILEAVALAAAGCPASRLEASYDEPTLEASERLRGIGLQEFCELACCRPLPRFRRDAHGWLQAAFSTTALPGILSNIANKTLLEGYNYVEDAWRDICKIASVTDFKSHSRYRMTGSFRFEKVGPGGELKHGMIDEQTYTQKAETHGIMFALTRQMMIDDDLGALTDIPRQIGIGAAEAIADAVWSLLLANPGQSDGRSFFHALHGNLLEGNETALSVDALTAAEVKFGEQTKPNGRPLGITPSILLVPTQLKVIAELLMKSTLLNESPSQPRPSMNPHTGKFRVVSSSYLSNSSFTGASAEAWYLLSDPNRLPALEVAFLGGMDRPTIERADADFNTLGIQFRGYIDFGVREQDWRAALKMTGKN